MRFRKILILGGVRSGKSRYAQELAEGSGKHKVFIATGEARDAEMTARIARHRAERGAGWETIETPLALPQAIRARKDNEAVVVDCLTLWLSNVMLAGNEPGEAIEDLAASIREARCALAVVSNEVGLGIVPESELGRRFRDWQGALNRVTAEECDAAIFMVSGCPLMLKPAASAALSLG